MCTHFSPMRLVPSCWLSGSGQLLSVSVELTLVAQCNMHVGFVAMMAIIRFCWEWDAVTYMMTRVFAWASDRRGIFGLLDSVPSCMCFLDLCQACRAKWRVESLVLVAHGHRSTKIGKQFLMLANGLCVCHYFCHFVRPPTYEPYVSWLLTQLTSTETS